MKKLFVFFFLAVIIFNLSAKDHNLSIGTSLGELNGQAQEIVYRHSMSEDKLSELLWNFNSLTYLGLDINYSWLKSGNKWGFLAKGSLKYGFPHEIDIMEDRDWDIKNRGYPNWLTNYSVHDNKTEFAFLTDLSLGMQFLIFNKFLFKTYFSYHYMNFSWTASGGSLLYPYELDKFGNPVDGHILLKPINVGTYEQIWHIFSPAISFYGEFNRFFDIEFSLELTPFIQCVAKDEHLLRDLVVTDYLERGIFTEPSLLFSYKPSNHFVLSFSFAYREISETRGSATYTGEEVYKEKGKWSYTFPNISGAGYSALDFGIIAKYKF
jgi:outer membrane protease